MTHAFAAALPGHAFFFLGLLLAAGTGASELGFSRIVRGWTNYSTAFLATHDLGGSGEFATCATFYTPPYTVKAVEFAAIVVWSEPPSETINFTDFTFTIAFWSSLNAFIAQPQLGDLWNLPFSQPSSILLDTVTRGGRPAHELRFPLTNATIVLSSCETYLIAVIARANTSRDGELYVPTARTDGPSDVQAGNIVPFGWQYLVDAGGFTIYHGQLATELVVERLGVPPSLFIGRSNAVVQLTWPAASGCYGLESTETLGHSWAAVTNQPVPHAGWHSVTLPSTNAGRFFRLAR